MYAGIIFAIQKVIGLLTPLAALVFILDLPLYLFDKSLFSQQYLALILGLVLAYFFLGKHGAGGKRTPPWWDVLLALASLVTGLYVAINYHYLLITISRIEQIRVVLATVTVLLVLEATRRVAGWTLVIVVSAFIFYAAYGNMMPGVLEIRAVPWNRLLTQLYLGDNFLYGLPLRISATTVFAFILFGKFLFGVGGGEFFIDLANSITGHQRGGPAKASVIASSMFATLSGSAVANVAATGTVTIPLMKRIGYSPVFAGAVEAAASTGGQIAPPVMGAAAFIMAEFLGIPYKTVVITAIVPAFLYYLCVFIQVDLEAGKLNLKGFPRHEMPVLKKVFASGWIFLIPMVMLVYSLFFLYLAPERAVLYSLGVLLVICLLKDKTRKELRKFGSLLESTTQTLIEVLVICAAAGFVVGLINNTGLGFTFSRIFASHAGENTFFLLVISMVVSIVLGMGMPVTASYLLLAVLVAPAMATLGFPPLLAHFFLFFYGTLSFLTPPVALASYVAASMAGASMMKTSLTAIRLAIVGFVVPFLLIYNPPLVFIGSPVEVVYAIVMASIAVACYAVGVAGYLFRDLNIPTRLLFIFAGVLLVVAKFLPILSVLGFGILALLVFTELSARKKSTAGSR